MTTYEAKQNICPLGLEVEKIHACKNDCILFRGDHANDTECPKCQTARYKRRNDGGDEVRRHGAPQKVAWYFPLIPRLRRLFASRKDAQLLRGTWRAGSRMITYDTQQIPHSGTSLITNMVHLLMIQGIFDLD